MTSDTRWLLPDGIDELLPERAACVERLRRLLLDDCRSWGYQYVIPPLVEFTDSLLVGLGADLDLLTCKFSDRISGRTLGIRADMTPQAARIDAHSLGETGVTRLCYAGSTLHSTAQTPLGGRSPIQLGAEVYGCADSAADLEVIELMLALLRQADLQPVMQPVTLDIGHVGIYQALVDDLGLDPGIEAQVFDALQRKSLPDLEQVVAPLPGDASALLLALAGMHGSVDVLETAAQTLPNLEAIQTALGEVQCVVDAVRRNHGEVAIYVDLAELRGFRYHTGLVFAAYLKGLGTAVAKGGRYDNVGGVFGRNRPATGFACDLKALAAYAADATSAMVPVSAPVLEDAQLMAAVAELRAAGRTVIAELGGVPDSRCQEQLVLRDGIWVCEPIVGLESK